MPLRCARCDGEVESMDDSCRNAPYRATAFTTHGHYGSTVFDPMNGCYLEINLCDRCIVLLAARDQILMGQDYKLVESEVDGIRGVIGRTPISRELVPWRQGLEHEGADDKLFLEPEEVGSDLYPEVQYHKGLLEALKEEK